MRAIVVGDRTQRELGVGCMVWYEEMGSGRLEMGCGFELWGHVEGSDPVLDSVSGAMRPLGAVRSIESSSACLG